MNYILDLPCGRPVPKGPTYLVDGKEVEVPFHVTSRFIVEYRPTVMGSIPRPLIRVALLHRSPYELTAFSRSCSLANFRQYSRIL